MALDTVPGVGYVGCMTKQMQAVQADDTPRTVTLFELVGTDLECTYSGKPGCACGCRGTYRYNPQLTHTRHGSPVREDDHGTVAGLSRAVRTMQRRLLEQWSSVLDTYEDVDLMVSDDGARVSLETGERVNTLYLRPGVRLSAETVQQLRKLAKQAKAVRS